MHFHLPIFSLCFHSFSLGFFVVGAVVFVRFHPNIRKSYKHHVTQDRRESRNSLWNLIHLKNKSCMCLVTWTWPSIIISHLHGRRMDACPYAGFKQVVHCSLPMFGTAVSVNDQETWLGMNFCFLLEYFMLIFAYGWCFHFYFHSLVLFIFVYFLFH